MLDQHCSMEMTNAANVLRGDIMKAKMEHKEYEPRKLKQDNLKYGLFDKEGKALFSELENKNIDLNDNASHNKTHAFHVTTIESPNYELDVRYIVIETDQLIKDIDKLRIYMIIILIIGTVFIGIIGYFLARLLLKPVKEKMEHMDQFIKDSAHELNTPVAVLMTSVSTFKQGRNVDKMLKYIVSSTKQISQVYNDIHFSAFNDIDESMDETIDLEAFVQDSVGFFHDIAITKNITIEAHVTECNIEMDRTKTQKVINNLISNAIKYSYKDSKIIVSLVDNVLSVQDFGIGISDEDQKEIFKRYKRGQNIEGGFGIGLDIVKRIAFEYDLKLDLKSKLKEGSTFMVDFSAISKS